MDFTHRPSRSRDRRSKFDRLLPLERMKCFDSTRSNCERRSRHELKKRCGRSSRRMWDKPGLRDELKWTLRISSLGWCRDNKEFQARLVPPKDRPLSPTPTAIQSSSNLRGTCQRCHRNQPIDLLYHRCKRQSRVFASCPPVRLHRKFPLAFATYSCSHLAPARLAHLRGMSNATWRAEGTHHDVPGDSSANQLAHRSDLHRAGKIY